MTKSNHEEDEHGQEAKLQTFLQWLQANKVELRDCEIKRCDSNRGFGIFTSTNQVSDGNGVLLVVPLNLAIAPMRVLQDPLMGPVCRAMFDEEEVDDRFLMILFLMIERLRKNSSWKPYLDMLPETFGNPLWFSDDEFSELKGTALYRATELQKKSLVSLYDNKVKSLVEKILSLDGGSEREACFEDFLWANSVFWARALNIPLPYNYVFQDLPGTGHSSSSVENVSETCSNEKLVQVQERKVDEVGSQVDGETSTSTQGRTIWVEGLVPGIDFCNHDFRAVATWEVDRTGSTTGVPFSMYLLSVGQNSLQTGNEITISYGNKGNEELLYLYGFVIENNPDDYLMVHYLVEAIQNQPFSDLKAQLLGAQKAEMRCLLPKNLLNNGFFPLGTVKNGEEDNSKHEKVSNYSWSGHRKTPSYLNRLVFPENFLSALRTIAMKEDEIFKVSALLEELVGSGGEREPTDAEVRAAVWEACGDSGALQLLVDLLNMRMMKLEEHSGKEEADTDLLNKAKITESSEMDSSENDNEATRRISMTRNKWSSLVYRRGQKRLTRLFLREADHALELALSEGN